MRKAPVGLSGLGRFSISLVAHALFDEGGAAAEVIDEKGEYFPVETLNRWVEISPQQVGNPLAVLSVGDQPVAGKAVQDIMVP